MTVWTKHAPLCALFWLAASCGGAGKSPTTHANSTAPSAAVGNDTVPVTGDANIPATNPNAVAHDPNAPILPGQGTKPLIGTDGWVAFDINPALGTLAEVQTTFVIQPSFDPNNEAVLGVFTQALQGNFHMAATCAVHDGFCRVGYVADGNVTQSPNLAFALGDTLTANFTDLGGGELAMRVDNPNTQQSASLTVHAPAMNVLYLADTGGGTAKDAIFSNTAITFSGPAAPACWPVTRGPRDSVVTPLYSVNALHCLAPTVVLRAKGTTASDPTLPEP